MITVHHLNNSRSQRVLWLLEELNIPYEIKRYERDPTSLLAPSSLKAVHPLGKSPVITDGENVVAESGAIIEYLLDKYDTSELRPASATPERLRYTYWLHYAEGSAMPYLLLTLVFKRLPKAPMPFFVRPVMKAVSQQVLSSFVMPQLTTHVSFMEKELEKSAWFAGDRFTAADIQMSFPVEAVVARGPKEVSIPKLRDFVERIKARPAYQRAVERGGPYEILD